MESGNSGEAVPVEDQKPSTSVWGRMTDTTDKKLTFAFVIFNAILLVAAVAFFTLVPSCPTAGAPATAEKGLRSFFETERLDLWQYRSPTYNRFPAVKYDEEPGGISSVSYQSPSKDSSDKSPDISLGSNSLYSNSHGSSSREVGSSSLVGASEFYNSKDSSSDSLLAPPLPSGVRARPWNPSDSSSMATHSVSTAKIPEDKWTYTNFKCGVQKNKPDLERVISGAFMAKPHSWPWTASLFRFGYSFYSLICTATLVSPRHVISAFTCIDKTLSNIESHYLVAAGKYDLAKDSGKLKMIEKIRYHPFAHRHGKYYNLILVTMKNELYFNDHIQPVCLPPQDKVVTPGRTCWACGYGGESVTRVEQTNITIWDESKCISRMKTNSRYVVNEYAVCGNRTTGPDKCTRDSGGPLSCKEGDKWVLYGVTTLALDCPTGTTAIYSAISFSMPWLCCFLGELPECSGIACDAANFFHPKE